MADQDLDHWAGGGGLWLDVECVILLVGLALVIR
jgi:hypothetical protein